MCHEKRLPEKWESSFNFVEVALSGSPLTLLIEDKHAK
jgi:hypothetical protein